MQLILETLETLVREAVLDHQLVVGHSDSDVSERFPGWNGSLLNHAPGFPLNR